MAGGHAVDYPADFTVSLLRVELQVLAAAIVQLYEIEVPFIEISLRIHHIVAVETGTEAVEVVIVA